MKTLKKNSAVPQGMGVVAKRRVECALQKKVDESTRQKIQRGHIAQLQGLVPPDESMKRKPVMPTLQMRQNASVSGFGVVQRTAIQTVYGTFSDDPDCYVDGDRVIMHLSFMPNNKVNADKIGLVQSVKTVVKGDAVAPDPAAKKRMTANGWRIDRFPGRNNPVYGAADLNEGQKLDETAVGGEDENYQLGYRKLVDQSWKRQAAMLSDAPTIGLLGKNGSRQFETAALVLEGASRGGYLGSVTWGVTTDEDGVPEVGKLTLGKTFAATPDFFQAAAKWNDSKTMGNFLTIPNSLLSEEGVELKRNSQIKWRENLAKNERNFVRGVVNKRDEDVVVTVPADQLKDDDSGDDVRNLPTAAPGFFDASLGVIAGKLKKVEPAELLELIKVLAAHWCNLSVDLQEVRKGKLTEVLGEYFSERLKGEISEEERASAKNLGFEV